MSDQPLLATDTNAETERDIEQALKALARNAADRELPLLERLTVLENDAAVLLSHYSARFVIAIMSAGTFTIQVMRAVSRAGACPPRNRAAGSG